VFTGRCLALTGTIPLLRSYFSPDGCEIWGLGLAYPPVVVRRWGIIKDRESDITKLQPLVVPSRPTGVFPWQSFRGHRIADGVWVLGPTKKRVLWLPHRWRTNDRFRTWCGRFLGLQHPEPPDIVILDFFE